MRVHLQRFLRDTFGNMSTMAAVAAVPLLGAAGAGVDMMRWNDASTELNAAMDNAVLAGTQSLLENGGDKTAALAVARKYFTATINKDAYSINTVDFKINSKGNGVASFGRAEIKTSLLNLVGIDSMTLLSDKIAEAAVAEAGSATPTADLEISLMLDVTGSMCNDNTGPCKTGTKITALKDAATELVNTVVWEDQKTFTSKIAIVPFSTRVRVGPDGAGSSLMKKLTNLEPTWTGWYKTCTAGTGGGGSEEDGGWNCSKYATQKKTNWKIMPCVTDRFYNSSWTFELTDKAPGSGLWLNAHDGGRMVDGQDSSNTKPTKEIGKVSSDPATHWNYEPDGKCYDVAESDEVLPLTNNKTALKNKIAGLEAFGATGGVLGTAFSWYMISPLWKSIWTGQSQPKDYSLLTQKNAQGKPKLRKIAILMTDGSYNTFRGWKGQDIKTLSNNAKQLCSNMKAKGIEIYTVGFALDSLPAGEIPVAKDMLQSCGSSIKHFYNSINAADLKQAFKDISNNVAELNTRLTK